MQIAPNTETMDTEITGVPASQGQIRPRVFILNNYPLNRVISEVELGETPDHVLFGVNRFSELGYEPIFLPYPAAGGWSRLQKLVSKLRLPLELGDLQQQMQTLWQVREGDIVFAPCGSQTHLLQYLRAIGLFKIPVVTLMHHPFPKGKMDFFRSWQRKLFVKGADKMPSLSLAVKSDLAEWGCPLERLEALEWGTDVEFYGPWKPPGQGVIATGRTGRDFKTFALGAANGAGKATIIGLEGQFGDPIYTQATNLNVIETSNQQPVPGQQKGWMKYPDLCRHMADHAAIAIPLYDQKSLAGITSLMDALGLGRAVLMTRNAHVDLDVEAHGIGFWLEPGDVEGWTKKLRWVNEHPAEVREMGLRARSLAESRFNSATFAQKLCDMLKDALARKNRY